MAVTIDQVVVELEARTSRLEALVAGVSDRVTINLSGNITPKDIAAIFRRQARRP